MEQKWMTQENVPKTDEEALQFLPHFNEGIYSDCKGIYECRRLMGDSILDAFIYTCRVYLGEKPETKP